MQHGITRLGTQVRLPDGREAAVVSNSLVSERDQADFRGVVAWLQGIRRMDTMGRILSNANKTLCDWATREAVK